MSTFLFFPESDYYVYIEFNFRSSLHKGPYIYDIHENVYLFTHPLPNSHPLRYTVNTALIMPWLWGY